MALMVGDGPNRGTSAPPPKRRLPKAPADDGPRAETRREGTRRPVQQQSLPRMNKRTPDQFSHPFWGELFNRGPKKPEQPIEMPEHWKPQPLSADGQPADVLRGVLPDTEGQAANEQGNLNIANQYAGKAAEHRRAGLRAEREKADRTETDKVLTAKEWARLTPMQQAAVQANADLAEAIARDFELLKKSNPQEDWATQFNKREARSDELFGEDGRLGFKGMNSAPNTLAFLDERGLGKYELAGKTLDDLVSGDALLDMDTVNALGKKAPQAGLAPADARYKNLEFAKNLAAGQLEFQEKLAATLKRGESLLSGSTSRTTSGAAASYGAPEAGRTEYNALRPETAQRIEDYMQILARTDSPLDQALGVIQADLAERGASDKETAQVWENMIERSRLATTGEGKWFDDIDFEMRPPDEVAKALGVMTLKRRETTK